MAFPPSQHRPQQPQESGVSGASHRPGTFPVVAPLEGEHKLEKLEFALAVALTRGDLQRSQQLRTQIAALGGNQEEPGT
ncbi:hypothetical protein KBY58_01380 [Cyanobium sp. HWJ4-Hawea]|uniref:hypothetical protein n=1 Tax=unclassified Cyanobium TaxID=2627006 RepID=UPI0020CBC5D1|nr:MULTISPECIES: hypothetical protein [unclassified Cyanobium]MCP9775587.1 hypothetical protein [Cyanobium sp. WAJ14-Wanaka]MCP9808083.1 hypothetical protein [Cyanobium sp. HWJ4-Hawea]